MNLSEIQIQSVDNICKLPEDVLIEIFSYLTSGRNFKSDLLNSTLVCKQWNRIISQTVELMDKLFLYLADCIEENHIKFEKHHRHVDLYCEVLDLSKNSASLLFCLDSLQKSLTSVSIRFVDANVVDFDLLNSLSQYQLSSLEFEEIFDFDDNLLSDEIKSVEFKNLNHLKLEGKTSYILETIKCKQLISFKCSPHFMDRDGAKTSSVVKFLNQLDRLDELAVSFQDCKFEIELKPKFTWKKLELSLSGRTYNDVAVQSVTALCSASNRNPNTIINVKNLVELEKLYRAVMNTCINISELRMDSKLPSKLNLIRKMPETLKVEVNMRHLKDEQMPAVFQKLPNVKRLKLKFTEITEISHEKETIELLQPFFGQITHLEGSPLHINELKFKNLTNLTVTIREMSLIKCIVNLKAFCLLNPTLKLLKAHASGHHSLSGETLILILYNELKGSIEKCEISQLGLQKQSSSEFQLFRQTLTEDQRRFFVFSFPM